MKNNNLIKGTVILMMANCISKILGAVFKIPVTYILKEEGMAVFSTAMGVYSTLLTLIISGFPFAMSRFISKENAVLNNTNIRKTVRLCTFLFCVMGILGSIFLFAFSDFFAFAMKDPKASLSIKFISPAVFFVSWGMVYKSYFQGLVNMVPTAISQILESVSRLILGVAGAYFLQRCSVEAAACGAVFGITCSEIIGCLSLFIFFIFHFGKLKKNGEEKRKREIIKTLSTVAFTMMMFSCISSLMGLLDVAILRNSLLKISFTKESADAFLLKYSSYTDCFDKLLETKKLGIRGARWLFGAYSGYANTISNLPIGIVGAISISVMPQITGLIEKKQLVKVNSTIENAFKYTLMIIMPCAFGLFFFSGNVLNFLFGNTASEYILKYMAVGVIFIGISQLFTSFLHAKGNITEPFLHGLIGIVIKILCDLFLVINPYFNIMGSVCGTVIGYSVMTFFNVKSLKKQYNITLNITECIKKPEICTVIMIVIMKLLLNPATVITKSDRIGFLICSAVGFSGYVIALSGFDCIKLKKIAYQNKLDN